MQQTLWSFLTARAANRRGVNGLTQAVRRRSSAIDPLQTTDRPGDAFESAWRGVVKRRVALALCLVGLWASGVEARLVYLQVVRHDDYLQLAKHQQNQRVKPAGIRGDIVDRNGEILAYSVPGEMVVGYPGMIRKALNEAKETREALEARNTKDAKAIKALKEANEVKDVAGTVGTLCEAFRDCTAEERTDLVSLLSSDKGFVFLRHAANVTPDQSTRVRTMKLPGIDLMPESRRAYPKLELASHVLGFVGVDGGLSGVEGAFDADIRGREGLVYMQLDGKRRGMETRVEQEATAGATIELTIDQYLQNIAERELRAGVEQRHADGGTAVVMNPQTGEVLALASYPAFDPNDLKGSSPDQRRNRAIQDVYEPGSTFKIVTASAALQEGVFSMSDTIDTSPGFYYLGKRRIQDTEGHNYGPLAFEDVIVKSSNVGATRIGLKVGAERFSRYVQRFGFGQKLLPNSPGQSGGIVTPLKAISDTALASMSMGYQVSVTPLQMASAVSAVANGGTLYEPHLVRATVRDGARTEIAPRPLREAINRETAATLTTIMEDVVRRGTGTKAQLTGYHVAGKTGTAYKALPTGAYSKTDYNASFVGFVPSRQPALAIVVVVDTPRGGVYFGGDVAAPIFKRIAEASLQYLAVPRTLNPSPSIVVAADDAAPQIIPTRIGLTVPPPTDLSHMPDVRGLTLREALRVLGQVGLQAQPSGTGLVFSQTPLAGAAILPGEHASLQLKLARPVASAPAAGGARR
jgi:cell division protein FtsI (penicillin-binding protein 3)